MIYNFGAGPGMLPEAVKLRIKEDFPNWHDGMSAMEISHRSQIFIDLVQKMKDDLRYLLQIPKNYEILFLSGGARAQFSMIPMNLLNSKLIASYAITGLWSKLAYQDASKFGNISVASDGVSNNYRTILDVDTWKIDNNISYLHYTANESIHGLEFPFIPDVSVPLVSDITSNILSKQIDVSKYAAVYASSQKNLGVAGVTIIIVDPQYLQSNVINTPILYDYKYAIKCNSMLNTPPTFSWYVMSLVLEWLIAQGGVPAIEAKNKRNAEKLYNYIDNSQFYNNQVDPKYRSRMNVVFTLADQNLDSKFLQEAKQYNCFQLKGHEVTGGMRASIYNAMPKEGVDKLIEFMQEFEKNHPT